MDVACSTMAAACEAGIPCFALELEHDIAQLEAEADRDELVSWHVPSLQHDVVGSVDLPESHVKGQCDDLAGCADQNVHASDAESDDDGSEDPSDAEVARIEANACMVRQCGKPLQPGAWRGCCKSPWCDREDRHRGLCNHKATIPGPAACPAAVSEDEEDEEDGEGNQDEACYEVPMLHGVECQSADDTPQASSGGHSHNRQVLEAAGGDEVASTFKSTGISNHQLQQQQCCGMETAQSPFTSPLESASTYTAADDTAADLDVCQDLLWGGSSISQLAAVDQQLLFAVPSSYQPLVKDLEDAGPCISSLVGVDSLCSLDQPMQTLQSAEDMQVDCFASPSSDSSSFTWTATKLSPDAGCSSSAPSSPSCASATAALAEAAMAEAFCMQAPAPAAAAARASAPGMLQHLVDLHMQHPTSCSSAASDTSAAAAVTVAAASDTPASAAEAAGLAAAAATAAEYVVDDAAAHAAAAALQEAAAGAVAAAMADPSSAAAAAAAVAAAAMPTLAVLQRPPRVRSKPSHTMAKAAAAVEACSPKSKKRPLGRMATNPSSTHCCTQCGAVSTPVWRAGPAGPKTLCNACGVRYMKVAKRK